MDYEPTASPHTLSRSCSYQCLGSRSAESSKRGSPKRNPQLLVRPRLMPSRSYPWPCAACIPKHAILKAEFQASIEMGVRSCRATFPTNYRAITSTPPCCFEEAWQSCVVWHQGVRKERREEVLKGAERSCFGVVLVTFYYMIAS